MYQVHKKNGELMKDYTEILNEQFWFYKDLYSKDTNVQFTAINNGQASVPNLIKEQFEEFVSKEELFDAMMMLKPNKVPGIDGLTLHLYQKIWKVSIDPYYAMLLQAFAEGSHSASVKRGMKSLIPKKDKDETLIRNWRPLTLLNYDYKIFAKALSNRMDTVMNQIIPPHQTGFVKGRSIFSNLCKTREIISYLNRKNKPGLIVIVDFEKCFDQIEFSSISGALNYLNYGLQFIKMILLLYSDFQVCTSNNGFLSQFFEKECGVNQGCPASPRIYTQTSAIISRLITENSDIHGISVNGLEHLLSQFADDTSAFLSCEPLCVNAFCETLEVVEQQFRLKVSYEKTSIY